MSGIEISRRIKAAFAAKGITPDKTIINYCEGGFRSECIRYSSRSGV